MAERYLAGESLNDLAADYGLGPTAVKRRLLDQGVAMRGRAEATRMAGRKISDHRKGNRELYGPRWKAAVARGKRLTAEREAARLAAEASAHAP